MTDQFTYISAFLSIVVALALAHLLAGIAGILRAKVVAMSWVLPVWIGLYLFGCVDYWFSLWGLRATTHWSLGYVFYLLGLATILYIGCHLVVPSVREEDEALDLAAFDEGHRRRYLAAFGAYIAVATVANLTIDGFANAVWINLATLVLTAVAWWRREARMQWVVAVAMVALITYYAVTFIPAL
jgi:hypothetical protein